MDFDWSSACHVEGAILSCRMIILPSDVVSALKCAAALVVTCICDPSCEKGRVGCNISKFSFMAYWVGNS